MTISALTEAKDKARANVPEVIRKLKTMADLTDADVGRALGLSRSVTQMRMTEVSQWSYTELYMLAEFFGLPMDLFTMEPREAVRTAVNEYDFPFSFEQRLIDLGIRSNRWLPVSAGQAA